MSKTDESSSQLTGVFGPAVIVAIGGLLAYFTFEPALESRRPNLQKSDLVPPPPSVPGVNAIHARLWDDPLVVAYEDSQTRSGEAARISELLQKLARKAICLNESEPDVQRYFETIASEILRLRGDKGRFVCLPVLVPGEPYDSDTESRKRTTYAVLSAFASCGYELSAPDRVSYVELPIVVDIPVANETLCVERFVVPVKVFRRTDVARAIPNPKGPDGVLVLWINEDQLGSRPLRAIGQILEGLFGNYEFKDHIDVRIIGPNDSTTLLEMATEDANWTSDPPNDAMALKRETYVAATKLKYYSNTYAGKPTLYSGRATISVQTIADRSEKRSRTDLSNFTDGRPKNAGLEVVRTIGTDWQLVQLLVKELRMRSAWPLDDDKASGPNSTRHRKLRHIVLVTESDTVYGGGLPAAFREAFPELLNRSDSKAPQHKDLLHVYTYLRGLDGKIPGDKQENDEPRNDPSKVENSGTDPLNATHPESIPASGRSQFDYLRRLEQQLVELDEKSRNAGDDGIRAIGVVGTDIYDKLLVLRALRKRFPWTWFFSTDLDAALSLPSEYPTTRNLIVASHFGLSLNHNLQRSALPFRDVYETATYFSTLLALDDDRTRDAVANSRDPWMLRRGLDENLTERNGAHPLVFEIGRSGPYQLTIPAKELSESDQNIHPPGSRDRHWLSDGGHAWTLLLLIVLAGAVAWCFSKDVREMTTVVGRVSRRADWTLEGKILSGLVLALAVLFLVLLYVAVSDHMSPSGEPFVLFERISIWPRTIIRYLVLVLSAAFVVKAFFDGRCELHPSASRDSLYDLCKTNSRAAAASSNCGKIFEEFRVPALGRPCLMWTLGPTAVFLVFGALLVALTGWPPPPFRGQIAHIAQLVVLLFVAIAVTFLTVLVVAHVEFCRQFVKKLGTCRADWLSSGMDQLENDRQPVERADLGELLTVRIIATSTEVAGEMVKYPFIVLFVTICSHHPALDMFQLPWSLGALWALIVAGLAWMAHTMRRDALKARDEVLGRLRDSLSLAINSVSLAASPKTKPSPAARRVQQLRQYISEVEREDDGAFRPLFQDPLVRALALGASGGLMLIHQLLP